MDGKAYHQETKFDIKHISYEKTIINWIEKILDEIKNKEYLSNSIKQYYNLIKNITFTGFTQEMEKNIENEITKSSENLESAFEIYSNYENAIKKLLSNNLKNIDDFCSNQLDLIIESDESENRYYRKQIWGENLSIGLEFDKGFPNNPFMGIYAEKKCSLKAREQINNSFNYGSTESWPVYKYIDFNIHKENAINLLDNTFVELIVKDIKRFIEVIDEIYSAI